MHKHKKVIGASSDPDSVYFSDFTEYKLKPRRQPRFPIKPSQSPLVASQQPDASPFPNPTPTHASTLTKRSAVKKESGGHHQPPPHVGPIRKLDFFSSESDPPPTTVPLPSTSDRLSNFGDFVKKELNLAPSGWPDSDHGPDMIKQGVYNFLLVPAGLEKLMFFGFLTCLDSFLFHVTYLPIRCVVAIYTLFSKPNIFKPAQLCDLLKGLLFAMCFVFLRNFNYSQMYHVIRGESAIKLYVIYNILEIFDKLCCSFGQDILTVLFESSSHLFTTKQRKNFQSKIFKKSLWDFQDSFEKSENEKVEEEKGGSRLRISSGQNLVQWVLCMLGATIYLFIHTSVQFIQVVTLNVSLNSTNNALFTLLVSNNFIELKGNVFKRFGNENLFQISCSDIVERFQIALYSYVIFIQNMRAAVFGGTELFGLVLIYLFEIAIDWIKHAFVVKFNSIHPQNYETYLNKICEDMCGVEENKFEQGDSSATVARRIGFVPIPLVALALRLSSQSIPYITRSFHPLLAFPFVFSLLFLFKSFLGFSISRYACYKTQLQVSGKRSSQPANLKTNSQVDNNSQVRATPMKHNPAAFLSLAVPPLNSHHHNRPGEKENESLGLTPGHGASSLDKLDSIFPDKEKDSLRNPGPPASPLSGRPFNRSVRRGSTAASHFSPHVLKTHSRTIDPLSNFALPPSAAAVAAAPSTPTRAIQDGQHKKEEGKQTGGVNKANNDRDRAKNVVITTEDISHVFRYSMVEKRIP